MLRIFSKGDFGYLDVTDLTPDERVELLQECHDAGWEVVQRGTFPVQPTLPAEPDDEPELAEHWYFRRRA